MIVSGVAWAAEHGARGDAEGPDVGLHVAQG